MAKVPSKGLNFIYNSVQLEDQLTSAELALTVETPDVTAFGDAGPRVVEGNYGYQVNLEFANDFATGEIDATLFARLGAGGAAFGFDPTGGTVGVSDPHYDSTSAVLQSYSIRAATGQAVTGSATLVGNSALARATS